MTDITLTLKDVFIDDSPVRYVPSPELVRAVETAYALKRPLLLSGEPGTGKTEAARWVAHTLAAQNLGFAKDPLIYHTKSTSTAQDLFYRYDAVGHFRANSDAAAGKATAQTTADFIELKALGLAFANALGKKGIAKLDPKVAARSGVTEESSGSVVLIDEIDKAPRDFPNDLLYELEHYGFGIQELGNEIELDRDARKKILIILTSNFEKSLPDPFLRRCVYYHIDFPRPEKILEIIQSRLGLDEEEMKRVGRQVEDFFILRGDDALQKKPSTSELLDWVRMLRNNKLLGQALFQNGKLVGGPLLDYMTVLLKKKEDVELFRQRGKTALSQPA